MTIHVGGKPSLQIEHLNLSSKQNPADLATRGISSSNIRNNSLWWQGHHILQNFTMEAAIKSTAVMPPNIDLKERKVIACNIKRSLLVITLILRFISNCKFKYQRQTGFTTTMELQNVYRMFVRKAQHET